MKKALKTWGLFPHYDHGFTVMLWLAFDLWVSSHSWLINSISRLISFVKSAGVVLDLRMYKEKMRRLVLCQLTRYS